MVVTDVSNLSVRELTVKLIRCQKERRYAQSAIEQSITFSKRLSRFMDERGFSNYTEPVGSEFEKEMRKLYAAGKFQMIQLFIARLDAIQQNKDFVVCRKTSVPIKLPFGLDVLCNAYIEHCQRKGLSRRTLDDYEKMCRWFLRGLMDNGIAQAEDIDASAVSGALLCLTSAEYIPDIQRFLRFLFQERYLDHDYSYIIPNFKRPKPLPSVYSMEEIRQIEAAVDRSTPRGKRDYAIVLMTTRLGIRAGDIVKMLLEQLDFQNSRVMIIQNKTKVPLSLPMVPELQSALLDYIENGRNGSSDPHVFLSLHPPYSGLTNATPGQTVRRVICEAGIEPGNRRSGSHAMRSSLASSMVNDNVSYEAVRRTLGHTNPNAIKSYVRVDAEHLRPYSLEPPPAIGQFAELLYGKKAVK